MESRKNDEQKKPSLMNIYNSLRKSRQRRSTISESEDSGSDRSRGSSLTDSGRFSMRSRSSSITESPDTDRISLYSSSQSANEGELESKGTPDVDAENSLSKGNSTPKKSNFLRKTGSFIAKRLSKKAIEKAKEDKKFVKEVDLLIDAVKVLEETSKYHFNIKDLKVVEAKETDEPKLPIMTYANLITKRRALQIEKDELVTTGKLKEQPYKMRSYEIENESTDLNRGVNAIRQRLREDANALLKSKLKIKDDNSRYAKNYEAAIFKDLKMQFFRYYKLIQLNEQSESKREIFLPEAITQEKLIAIFSNFKAYLDDFTNNPVFMSRIYAENNEAWQTFYEEVVATDLELKAKIDLHLYQYKKGFNTSINLIEAESAANKIALLTNPQDGAKDSSGDIQLFQEITEQKVEEALQGLPEYIVNGSKDLKGIFSSFADLSKQAINLDSRIKRLKGRTDVNAQLVTFLENYLNLLVTNEYQDRFKSKSNIQLYSNLVANLNELKASLTQEIQDFPTLSKFEERNEKVGEYIGLFALRNRGVISHQCPNEIFDRIMSFTK